MADAFERALRAVSEHAAAQAATVPAASVRARGDRLRVRRRAATAALSVVLFAGLGGAALTVRLTAPAPAPPAGPGPASHTASTAPVPTSSTTVPSPGADQGRCRSVTVTRQIKDAVTRAYLRAQPDLAHIAPEKGRFFYGVCGRTAYAATSFRPTAAATDQELVSLQDEGGAAKYFRRKPGGGWVYVATDGAPRSARGCAAVRQIPPGLAEAWNDCR